MTKAGVAAVAGALVALTACSSATPADPSQPLVAFDDSWGQLFVVNLDGSGLRQVTPTAADQPDSSWTSAPALSPDGRRLAYVSGPGSIDILDLASDAVTKVHENGSQPEFSPNGETIAFTTGGRVNVMDSDGANVRAVGPAESGGATFSPDGSRLLFTVAGYIVEVPTAGGEPTVVLRDQFWNADAVSSPDGDTIVFASNHGGNNGSELYSIPVAAATSFR